MIIPNTLKPQEVFKYFYEISEIPRGSGNMVAIADYCIDFAKKHSLRAVRDEANNVVIYKNGTAGYENAEPVIVQVQLDMGWQKTEDSDMEFLRDG